MQKDVEIHECIMDPDGAIAGSSKEGRLRLILPSLPALLSQTNIAGCPWLCDISGVFAAGRIPRKHGGKSCTWLYHMLEAVASLAAFVFIGLLILCEDTFPSS